MNGLAGSGGSGFLYVVGDIGSARGVQAIRIFFITAGHLDWVQKGRVGQLYFLNQIVFQIKKQGSGRAALFCSGSLVNRFLPPMYGSGA